MKQIFVDNLATNYYISEDGKCYNAKYGRWLVGQLSNSGYLNYNLTLNNNIKRRLYAHRLVAWAYIPNPNNKTQVNHKNGDKLDNRVTNLEWVTSQENTKHSIDMNLKTFKPVYRFNKNRQLIGSYKTVREAAMTLGISDSLITQELNKAPELPKALTAGSYWSHSDDNNFKIENTKSTGKSKKVYQYSKEGSFISSYNSTGEAARAVNGVHSHIGECCRGKIKSYKGYKWSYNFLDDIVSTSSESQSSS